MQNSIKKAFLKFVSLLECVNSLVWATSWYILSIWKIVIFPTRFFLQFGENGMSHVKVIWFKCTLTPWRCIIAKILICVVKPFLYMSWWPLALEHQPNLFHGYGDHKNSLLFSLLLNILFLSLVTGNSPANTTSFSLQTCLNGEKKKIVGEFLSKQITWRNYMTKLQCESVAITDPWDSRCDILALFYKKYFKPSSLFMFLKILPTFGSKSFLNIY